MYKELIDGKFKLAVVGLDYAGFVVAVNHNEFLMYDENYFRGIAHEPAVLFDLKGIYRDSVFHLKYWTL
jgi:UDP-N-acetyl-D-glucosamine/UDP-N-acetyl-D-galactosamine dehydrogenase